jgi:RimJ/RimL family protein N-acetyltransferase
MESDSDIRFEACVLDEARNMIASSAFSACRTATLPVKLDNSAELFFGEKTANQDVMMKILYKNHQTIGIASIADIDFKNRHCQVNFAMDNQDSSVTEKFIEKIIFHCKNRLNMIKINITLPAENTIEQTLRKTGFEKEVTLKQHKYLDGAFHDVIWYSYFCDSDGTK